MATVDEGVPTLDGEVPAGPVDGLEGRRGGVQAAGDQVDQRGGRQDHPAPSAFRIVVAAQRQRRAADDAARHRQRRRRRAAVACPSRRPPQTEKERKKKQKKKPSVLWPQRPRRHLLPPMDRRIDPSVNTHRADALHRLDFSVSMATIRSSTRSRPSLSIGFDLSIDQLVAVAPIRPADLSAIPTSQDQG